MDTSFDARLKSAVSAGIHHSALAAIVSVLDAASDASTLREAISHHCREVRNASLSWSIRCGQQQRLLSLVFDALDQGSLENEIDALLLDSLLILLFADDHIKAHSADGSSRLWEEHTQLLPTLKVFAQTHVNPRIRESAARIVILFGVVLEPLLHWRLYSIYQADNEKVFSSLCDAAVQCFESRNGRLWPAFGYALTAERLVWLADKRPAFAQYCAVEFGFMHPALEDLPRDLWAVGLSAVDCSMSDLPAQAVRADTDGLVSILQRRLLGLIPTTESKTSETALLERLKTKRDYSHGVLLAAIRQIERVQVRQMLATHDFNRGFPDQRPALFRFLNRPTSMLVESVLKGSESLANELDVRSDWRLPFLLDYAAALLAETEDLRLHEFVLLRGRWRAIRDSGCHNPDEVTLGRTDAGVVRCPAALFSVLPSDRIAKAVVSSAVSSPALKALFRIQNLLPSSNWSGLLQKDLELADNAGQRWLTPIGIEVQIPRTDLNLVLGWKELFRSCGIHCPQRPECHTMFEIACPPGAHWSSSAGILDWVIRSTLAVGTQDLAVHVSLQGDLGTFAAPLAFVQLFLNQSTALKRRSERSASLVMSKGLVCRNHEIVRCHWTSAASVRTEFRVFLYPFYSDGVSEAALQQVCSGIRETQLLASAYLATNAGLRQTAFRFAAAVKQAATAVSDTMANYLDSDVYGATGDFRAHDLIGLLPIVELRERANAELTSEQRQRFVEQLRQIRKTHADEVEMYDSSGYR
ncbi:MAG: hypothetical protein JNL58_20045 [Planctomyces sp.]|nr:hypothetical protein [Planctomyces sp.]